MDVDRHRWSLFAALVGLFFLSPFLTACDENATEPPPPVQEEVVTFATVQQALVLACGNCHGETSGRAFLVTMDSMALAASGLVNPGDPVASLLLTKPRSASAHGGGVVNALSDADVTRIAEWIGTLPPLVLNTLSAEPVGSRVWPHIDGFANEAVWRGAQTLVAQVGGGWADAEEVILSAAYDDEYLYVLARWFDDAESVRRSPWVKLEDGTWTARSPKPTPADGVDWTEYMGATFEEEASDYFYEDKFAMIWNTYGATTVAGFDQQGCSSVCHDPANGMAPGTSYFYSDHQQAAKKYTNAPNEIADMWHWKLVRQNHHYKIDDQHVHYWARGDDDPAHAGRSADSGSGGYASNPANNGRPMYRGPSLTVPPFYILDAEKIPVTDAELDAMPVGAMLPNMITKGPNGVRSDVDAYARFDPNTSTWTLEIRRRLNTDDVNDVQFDDLTREYYFGAAVFDNAQIEHSWTPAVYKMLFGN